MPANLWEAPTTDSAAEAHPGGLATENAKSAAAQPQPKTPQANRGIRIRERVEAAVMGAIYGSPPPLCDIPDKGMFLAPRWDSEQPIVVSNSCLVKLHGLPARLEV